MTGRGCLASTPPGFHPPFEAMEARLSTINEVPELPGWRFVKDDMHRIAEGVEKYENGRTRLARYVARDGQFVQGQLAVLREFEGVLDVEKPEKRRWWVIVIRCQDEDGNAMCGTPDRRILNDMARFDTWARNGPNSETLVKKANMIREQRDKLASEAFRASIDDDAGKIVRAHKRRMSINDRAFIPERKVS